MSYFHGISIYMHYNDHAPPHFHAIYGESEAQVNIETGNFMEGRLPAREARLVLEWASQHREELTENWQLRLQAQPLKQISALE